MVYIDNIKLEEIYGNYSTLNTFVLLIEISSDAHWSDIRLRWNLVCRLYCNLCNIYSCTQRSDTDSDIDIVTLI